MTRRKKVLVFTWLLSTIAAVPVVWAVDWGWMHLAYPIYRDGLLRDLGEFEHLAYRYGSLAVCSLALPPVVYASWQATNMWFPRDADGE